MKKLFIFRPWNNNKIFFIIGGDQELGIELDDADWDLFDQEVKLEPINLTNGKLNW